MAVEKVHASFLDVLPAASDLSAKLHYFCKITSAGKVDLASAATDMVIGVITEADVADRPVTFQTAGMGKAIAGGTITAGDKITTDSNGKAVATTTAGNRVIGVARASAVAGEIVSFHFIRGHNAVS